MVAICSSVEVLGRQDARGVSGVDAGQLDVLHHSRNEYILAVADGVGLTLSRMVQETVDQNRTVGGNADGLLHIEGQRLVVMHNLHAASA